MSGYRWDPVFRVVPLNSGAETVYWLADRLTDVGSHTRIALRYPESMNVREDINRSLRPVIYGIRPEVDIECAIWTMADQQFLAEIENALLRPQAYTVYLSLDGGVVYRAVALAGLANAEPISGKTVVGAKFTLRLRCVDLVTSKPVMTTDPSIGAEMLPDGGQEQWAAGPVPQAWQVGGVCSVAQESTIISGGTYSAKVLRSDSGSSGTYQPITASTNVYRRGVWYRFTGRVRGTVAYPDAVKFRVFNSTRTTGVESDGKTWSTNGVLVLRASITGSFDSLTAYFRFPADFVVSDSILGRFQGAYTASPEALYYDDLSIYGPVLRPGVATW